MALIVWSAMGIALWHFTIFLPDRFWQGIVGAFVGAWLGAAFSGAAVQLVLGRSLGQTDVLTALAAIPGTVLGIAVIWWLGVRAERRAAEIELEIETSGG